MSITYLFVPREEEAEAQALGAQWCSRSQCWYISADVTPRRFSKWLLCWHDSDLCIASRRAWVAAAMTPCRRCRADIEVITIHCDSGMLNDLPVVQFTVADIAAIDGNLARQLKPWPLFRKGISPLVGQQRYLNHCPRCGRAHDDRLLNSKPGHPFFFSIPSTAQAGALELTPLKGTIRLRGSVHFEMEEPA